jgi:hypothetical protein
VQFGSFGVVASDVVIRSSTFSGEQVTINRNVTAPLPNRFLALVAQADSLILICHVNDSDKQGYIRTGHLSQHRQDFRKGSE